MNIKKYSYIWKTSI